MWCLVVCYDEHEKEEMCALTKYDDNNNEQCQI